MATRVQLRRDTAANWASVNPVLAQGELGFELGTDLVKIGDGTTAWNSLGYLSATQAAAAAAAAIAAHNAAANPHPQYFGIKRVWHSAIGWTRNSDNATDTVDGTLASFTVPGGVMGANDVLELVTTWSHTASTSTRRLRPYFGGTQCCNIQVTTALNSSQHFLAVSNRNAANAQIMGMGNFAGFGSAAQVWVTGNVNTSVDVPVDIKCSWAANVAGEFITLERYFARLLSPV